MDLATSLAVLTGVYGTAFALAPLLQLRRIAAHGGSEQVSLVYFAGLALNLMLWLGYGIAIANPVMVIANIAGVITAVATVAVILRYRRIPSAVHDRSAARTAPSATPGKP